MFSRFIEFVNVASKNTEHDILETLIVVSYLVLDN